MTATSVQPFTITRPSEELRTNVRRTVGYRADCGCGWLGPVRVKRGTAEWDKLVHRHKVHP